MNLQKINYSKRESDFSQMFVEEYKDILTDIQENLDSCRVEKLCCLDTSFLALLKEEERMLKQVKRSYQILLQKNLN
jgi:hypothetical protein